MQVVTRLRRMNAHHAQHAWDQRIRDPLSPHALAFFGYAPDSGGFTLRTATRLFLAGDAPRPLPRLVYEVTRHVVDCQQQRLDPIVRLSDRRESMPVHGRFLGVGVSSLDSRWQTWDTTARTANGVLDVPGRCVAVLNDGTVFVVDRGGREQYDTLGIRTTAELDVGERTMHWRLVGAEGLLDGTPPVSDQDRQEVGHALHLLVELARVLGAGRP